jgi:hypothetical protein
VYPVAFELFLAKEAVARAEVSMMLSLGPELETVWKIPEVLRLKEPSAAWKAVKYGKR